MMRLTKTKKIKAEKYFFRAFLCYHYLFFKANIHFFFAGIHTEPAKKKMNKTNQEIESFFFVSS